MIRTFTFFFTKRYVDMCMQWRKVHSVEYTRPLIKMVEMLLSSEFFEIWQNFRTKKDRGGDSPIVTYVARAHVTKNLHRKSLHLRNEKSLFTRHRFHKYSTSVVVIFARYSPMHFRAAGQ